MLLADYSQAAMLTGMEEVLVGSPDDGCLHRAYAGSLLASRDPAVAARGRLIEAQLRLEEPSCPPEQRRKLEARRRKLQKDHARAWLGPALSAYLLDRPGYCFELARGWLDAVTAPGLDAGFIRALAEAPLARLLLRLAIESDRPDGSAALAPLREAPFLGRLALLRVGGVEGPAEAVLARLAGGPPSTLSQ
jgi:hypothetical protein